MSLTESQEQIMQHIKLFAPITQSEITNFFKYKWGYKTDISARNGVGKILKRLEGMKLIKKTKEDSGKAIKQNVWSAV